MNGSISDKIIFPKIKYDTGGAPMEYLLADVPFEELLRAPEDVLKENEFTKDYDTGGLRFRVASKYRKAH